ncbi:hypothetical protein [Halorubrum sp. DTA98]|uniref:hypothetical protein n=1 Tax=Halorubrum sp. DTA98 TaxID=3402163 RepID=UPI003AAB0362
MADRASREQRPTDERSVVDDGLKRRLMEAYLNDEEDALVVTAVRAEADGADVVVEMRPPHGDTTHTERFAGPKHGSLDECEDLLAFLEAAGVSPLEIDDVVGTRIPATFDAETGWQVDEAYVPRDDGESSGASRVGSSGGDVVEWLRTYRNWLLVVLIVGVELLFVVVLILLFA